MKRLIIGLSLLFMSVQAYAIPVYQDLGDSTIVYGNNYELEWLDLSITDGLSPSAALAANPGYSVATESQYRDMLDAFYPDLFSLWDPINPIYTINDDFGSLPLSFIDLFGITSLIQTPDFDLYFARGFYFDEFGNQREGGVDVFDFTEPQFVDSLLVYVDNNFIFPVDFGSSQTGIFLVRTPQQEQEQTIPEPSMLSLLGLGLLGMIGIRRTSK